MARVDREFRAEVLSSTPPRIAARPAVSAAPTLPLVPRDTRTLTRGVKSTLSWSQTRVQERRDRQESQGDRYDGQPGGSGSDADLQDAQETLADVLAELKKRGLGNHPRALALAALRDRLTLSRAARRPIAPAGRKSRWQTVSDELQDLWEAVVSMVQTPEGRAARKTVLLARARQAAARGDRAGERTLLRRILLADPRDAAAHSRLGRLYLDSGELDLAEPHLGAAAAATPRDPKAQIALGEIHYRRHDPESAIVFFGQALRLNPDHSDANAWLGILAYDAQRPVEAQRFLERAIALDSNNAVARYYLAQLSFANGDHLRADYQLSVVHRLDPKADLERFSDPANSLAGARSTAYTGWLMPKTPKTTTA